ncbi:MAG: NTE family protein [Salinirussus sp.]|jgi:NTE family protein
MTDSTDAGTRDPDVAADGGTEAAADGSSTAGGTDGTNVAIACQGGGSHTAFTAGVLQTLLTEVDWSEYELVGISGTSGGAFNALAAWYGLVTEGPERSAELLEELWDALSAKGQSDRMANSFVTTLNRLEKSGFPFPQVSPYEIPGDELGKQRIRDALEGCIDFETIPPLCGRASPELVVGTVDVNGGVFETFTNEDVTVEAVLASAAVPDLFEAVEMNGHSHWDGLFSQNPPVYDLMHQPPGRKPDELWIVQINPQEVEETPTSTLEINDRRNELSGNISLNQELGFIERVNDWVETGKLPADEFTHTEIRRIEMGQRYDSATKVDRDPDFIGELMESGREAASDFLTE